MHQDQSEPPPEVLRLVGKAHRIDASLRAEVTSPAQTNGQLLVQLVQAGYSTVELGRVRDAYLLGMQLFSGVYCGSGKPVLAHEVGSASLTHRYGGSFETVLAALLHGAYIVGDWGDHHTRLAEKNRQAVRRVVGDRAEAYIHGVALLQWDTPGIAALAARVHTLNELERTVVFIKLAEEVDHFYDYGAILFFRDAGTVKQHLHERRGDLLRLATHLGPAELVAEIERGIELTLAAELPAEIVGIEPPARTAPLLLIPRSCHRNWTVRLYWARRRLTAQLVGGMRRLLAQPDTTRPAAGARAEG